MHETACPGPWSWLGFLRLPTGRLVMLAAPGEQALQGWLRSLHRPGDDSIDNGQGNRESRLLIRVAGRLEARPPCDSVRVKGSSFLRQAADQLGHIVLLAVNIATAVAQRLTSALR